MDTSIFDIVSPNGKLRGKKVIVSPEAPLILLACGHNGFYHFGMFPTLQEGFALNGFSSVAFNYSHSGITDDGDVFNDLDAYAKNCRRLEAEDLLFLMQQIQQTSIFGRPKQLYLLGHSMGGFSAGFAAKMAIENGIHLSGLGFLCALKTLDIRTKEVMNEWKKNGLYFRLNPRTNQNLPQGEEFLNETLLSDTLWNLSDAIQQLDLPIFVAHAVEDESVPFEHGRSIFSWIYKNNRLNGFLPIPNAGHTLNTVHPIKRDSDELQFFIKNFCDWIKTTLSNTKD
jgi:uncharacterized protein